MRFRPLTSPSLFTITILTAPAHRHQSSLEGLIDFHIQQPLFTDAGERAQAIARFYRIVGHFETIETTTSRKHYNRPALIRLTFEYARSPESQDRFLAFFFQALAIGALDGDFDLGDLGEPLFRIAEFLMINFFLPRTLSIPQPVHPSLLLSTLQSPRPSSILMPVHCLFKIFALPEAA